MPVKSLQLVNGATKLVVTSSDLTIVQNGSSTFSGGDTINANLSAIGDGAPIPYYNNYTNLPVSPSANAIVATQHTYENAGIIYPAGLWQYISSIWTYLGLAPDDATLIVSAGKVAANVGTTTDKLVQLTATGLPAVSGQALTGLTGTLTSSANTIKVKVNGGTDSATVPLINTNALSSATNTLTSTINGVASSGVTIVNTNVLNSAVNTLTSTINGVASSGVTLINTNTSTYLGNTLTNTLNGVATSTPVTIDGSSIKTQDPATGVGTDTVLLDTAINNLFANASLTPYVVPTNLYPTWNSAITAAKLAGATIANPKLILIKPGSYTEDVILYDGIFVRSMFGMHDSVKPFSPGDPNHDNCVVTLTPATTFAFTNFNGAYSKIYGITINVPASCFGVFASGPSFCYIDNCKVLLADNTSTFLASNSIGRFIVSNTTSPISAGKIFDMPNSQGYIDFYNCYLPSGVASTSTPSSGTGLELKLDNTDILGGFSFTGAPFSINSINSNIGAITSTAASANIAITGGIVNGNLNISSGLIILQNGYQVAGTLSGGATFKKYFWRENTVYPQASITKQLTGYNGSDFFVNQNAVQTTDATPTLIGCTPLATNETYTVTGRVVAADSTHANGITGRFVVGAQRAGGNISLIGTPIVEVMPTGTGTFDIVADTSSQAIAVQATGEAGITYNWVVTFEYHKVLTNA